MEIDMSHLSNTSESNRSTILESDEMKYPIIIGIDNFELPEDLQPKPSGIFENIKKWYLNIRNKAEYISV
jgi:hypothetical protein